MAAAMMLLLCSVLGAPKRIDSYFKKLVSYHTRAISMNTVRATAWTLHDAAQ